MARTMTSSETRRFLLHGTRTAKVATVMPDGTPHAAPAWFVLDGGQVVFTTGADSAKGRDLRRDPRVALVADDEEPPYAIVHLRGVAAISSDPSDLLRFAIEIGAGTWARNAPKSSAAATLSLVSSWCGSLCNGLIPQNNIAGYSADDRKRATTLTTSSAQNLRSHCIANRSRRSAVI